jgi:hypothetical protein
MFAWVLRFGLLGNPGDGLWMIIMCCLWVLAFDYLGSFVY